MQSNTPAVPVPNQNADWRQRMTPECWRVLLLGRLNDLDRAHLAYCAVETLVMQFDAKDESDTLSGLAAEDLSELLQILNDRLGQLLVEAREAYVGCAQ